MRFSFGRTISFLSLLTSVFLAQCTLLLISLSLPSLNYQSKSADVLGYQSQPDKYIYISDKKGYSSGGLIALSSQDEPTIAISSWNLSGQAEVELYKGDIATALTYLTHDDKGMQTKSLDLGSLQFVTKQTYSVTSQSSTPEQLSLPLEESGVWIVKIVLGDTTEYGVIIRSRIGAITKQSENNFVFWVQNFANRQVVDSGNLKIYNLQNEVKEIASTSLNSQGSAQTPVLSEADIAIVEANGDVALVPLNLKYINSGYSWTSYEQRKANSRFFTFTDRPVYQPGDTIHFKSVIRDDDDARFSLPQGSVDVVVRNDASNDEETICKTKLTISANGSVDGKCSIPSTANPGYYSLVIYRDETDDMYRGQSYTYFQVEQYRKPEYYISVSADKDSYLGGDTIKYTITGAYFFGQPLAGQRVTYKIFSSDYWQYDHYQEVAAKLSDETNFSSYYGQQINSGEVLLDSTGQAVVEIPAQGIEGKNQVVGLEATVADQTQNPSFARKNTLVYAGIFEIYKKDYYSLYTAGKNASLSFVVKPWNKEAKVNGIDFTAVPIRETWVAEYVDGEKYPKYHKETETLPEIKAKTNSQGELTINFVPTKHGAYKINFQAQDERGNALTKLFYIWVSKPGEPLYTSEYTPPINLQLNQAKYNPGDNVKLTIHSSIADRDVLVSFERGSVHRYQTVRIAGTETSLELPLRPTDTPNMNLVVSGFSQTEFQSTQVDVKIPPHHKKLAVSIQPDRSQYGPGDEVLLNITAKNSQGEPQAAELTVWAVDKAIYELAADNVGDIHSEFWFDRYSYVPTSHSLEGIMAQAAEAGGGCFTADTKITLGDGNVTTIDAIKTGDTILTRTSEANDELVKAKVTSTHKAVVDGYLIINGYLKITSNHILWVNDQWQPAGNIQIDDQLIDLHGKAVRVSSIEWQAGKVAVYNLEIDKYHTFFADSIWVHNQKGGGGRSIFKDTAYWNPQVTTDSQGKAQFRFKLPDNLTTWTIAAVGATNDTIVGQSSQDIVVTKNVIIRPVLPNIVRLGDELEVSAVVHNYTDKDQEFQVSLSMSDALVKNSTQSAEIKAKTQEEITWKIQPIQVSDKNQVIMTAWVPQEKEAFDQVSLMFPIIPYGYKDEQVVNKHGNSEFEIKLSQDSDLSQSVISLQLAPTLMGNVLTALESLVEYPYGCSEQTATKLYAALLAKEHGLLKQQLEDTYNIDELVNGGLRRLKELQHSDGGFGWWHTGSSDPFITSYVTEVIIKAKELKYPIDLEMISKLNGYYFTFEPKTQNEKIIRAYALSYLDPTHSSSELDGLEGLDDDLLALAAITNLRNGHSDAALNRLTTRAQQQGDSIVWRAGHGNRFGSAEATTGMVLNALVLGGESYEESSTKAMRYLLQSRHKAYWTHTYSSIQAIKGLLAYAKAGKELNPNFSYAVLLDGEQITKGHVDNKDQTIKKILIDTQKISNSGSSLKVTMNGSGQLYSTLTVDEWRTSKSTPPVSNGLTISRRYINSQGQPNRFAVGDIVTVELTVGSSGGPVNYVVIEDQLPAGLVPINTNLKNEQANLSKTTNYFDIAGFEATKTGAVLSAYELEGIKQFSYKARVVNAGTFHVPPAITQLMYAPENYARTDSVTIEVDQDGGRLLSKLGLPKLEKNNPIVIVIGLITLSIASAGLAFYLKKRKHKYDQKAPFTE